MAIYKVLSVQTDLYITTEGSKTAGNPVVSKTGVPCIPDNANLTFSARVSGLVTFVTVKGEGNHYVNVDTKSGLLVWGEAYEWQVASTSKGTYEFYPKNGQNLYWYQNKQIADKVGAKGGSLLLENEPFFVLISSD
ncbi:hypothetical protein AX14_009994 [Amanita brunnescens Koide BX004]|nr:hypothetical protein AX14_009994 [Amanita brunnescens Koide BX004]